MIATNEMFLFDSEYELVKECIVVRKEQIKLLLETANSNDSISKEWNEFKLFQLEKLEKKLTKMFYNY